MFDKRLKKLRQQNNITQWKLAEILNLSPSTITMYEHSRRLPDIGTIIKIANYFNVSVDYLIGNSNILNINIIAESELLKSINNLSPKKLEILKMFIEVLNNDNSNIDN